MKKRRRLSKKKRKGLQGEWKNRLADAAAEEIREEVLEALSVGDGVLAVALASAGRLELGRYCWPEYSKRPDPMPDISWSCCNVTRAGILGREIIRLRIQLEH